jgi:hypothetical protein
VGQPDPRSPEDRVADVVGDLAPDLVRRIRAMLEDLDSGEPPLWDSEDVAEVGRQATTWLRDRYPKLSDDAIKAGSNQFMVVRIGRGRPLRAVRCSGVKPQISR